MVFSRENNENALLRRNSTNDTGVFRWWKQEGLFVESLCAPKRITEISRPEPFLVWQSFCNPRFWLSSYIYWNTVLLIMLGLIWGYKSRFDVITSNKPYWNYHGFLSAWGVLLNFSVPRGTENIAGLSFDMGSVPRLTLCITTVYISSVWKGNTCLTVVLSN